MAQKENPLLDKRTKDRIKNNVKLANEISRKVTSLEMRRPPSGIGANLSDIATSLEECNELLDQFLSTDVKDREAIGDVLTSINIEVLEHISYHIKHLKRPLGRIIEFCYEDTKDDGD